MRSAEELQAELTRTRRRLHRVTGVMTLVFAGGLALVFAAVGGALVVVDKRAAQTLEPAPRQQPTPSHQPRQAAASAPQHRAVRTVAQAAATPPPATATSPRAGASAGASARAPTTTAAAPANPPAPPPQAQLQAPAPARTATTTGSANAAPPAPKQQPQQPSLAGGGTGASQSAQPAPSARPSPPIETKHAARTRHERRSARKARDETARRDADADNPRDDARETVGAAPSEATRSGDARAQRRRGYVRARADDDEEAADARGPRRVIVLGPRQRYAPRGEERDDDQGGPPRQRGLFGGVLSGIFGPPDR